MIGIKTAAAFAAAGVLGAVILTHSPAAHADGVLSDVEYAYVVVYGAAAVCPTLDDHPSKAGVFGIAEGIMDDGFDVDSAADIINASVREYCPRHWPLLQRIGAAARGESGRQAA
jgi:hypothetical protein